MHWIKVEPRHGQAEGPPLSTGVSFVRIDPEDWKLPQDNQRVSSLVFQRSPIIIVVESNPAMPKRIDRYDLPYSQWLLTLKNKNQSICSQFATSQINSFVYSY